MVGVLVHDRDVGWDVDGIYRPERPKSRTMFIGLC